jgi:hypothetical protein
MAMWGGERSKKCCLAISPAAAASRGAFIKGTIVSAVSVIPESILD